MHELPVTQNILEIALRHAQNVDARQIVSINLVIGELASFVDDSISFYWDIIAKDTIAEGARINFQRIDLQVKCIQCDTLYHPSSEAFACPMCGGQGASVVTGKEFFLESIEVE